MNAVGIDVSKGKSIRVIERSVFLPSNKPDQ